MTAMAALSGSCHGFPFCDGPSHTGRNGSLQFEPYLYRHNGPFLVAPSHSPTAESFRNNDIPSEQHPSEYLPDRHNKTVQPYRDPSTQSHDRRVRTLRSLADRVGTCLYRQFYQYRDTPLPTRPLLFVTAIAFRYVPFRISTRLDFP